MQHFQDYSTSEKKHVLGVEFKEIQLSLIYSY